MMHYSQFTKIASYRLELVVNAHIWLIVVILCQDFCGLLLLLHPTLCHCPHIRFFLSHPNFCLKVRVNWCVFPVVALGCYVGSLVIIAWIAQHCCFYNKTCLGIV
jgi:hypothetical protein